MLFSKKILLFISIIVIAFILIILLFASMFQPTKDQTHNSGQKSLYQQQADKICTMLHQAMRRYLAADAKQAYNISENAYWDVYDNILEIKYRPYVTPAYIFSVEGKFHAISDLMKAPVTDKNKQAIRTKIKTLCIEVNRQAHELEKHH